MPTDGQQGSRDFRPRGAMGDETGFCRGTALGPVLPVNRLNRLIFYRGSGL